MKDILSGLRARAKQFNNFKDFSRDYSIEGNHGIYYHLTDNPNFQYNSNIGSRDMSSMSDGSESEKGSFMVTADLEYWDSYYNCEQGTDRAKKKLSRPYVAIVDLSNVPDYRAVNRGFGHEIYLTPEQASKVVVLKVVNRKQAKAFASRYEAKMPQSEEELKQIWEEAHSIVEKILKEAKTVLKWVKVPSLVG